MKVKVLGAGLEVGTSGFLVNCEDTNYLLDYGGNLGKNLQAPMHVMPKEVDSIIVTHAHLDHSGYVPLMYVSGTCPVYATAPTFDLSRFLIEDMLRLEKEAHPFGLPEVNKMYSHAKKIRFREKNKPSPMKPQNDPAQEHLERLLQPWQHTALVQLDLEPCCCSPT